MNKLKIKAICCIALIGLSQTVFAGSVLPHQRWIAYFWEKNTTEPLVSLTDVENEKGCNEVAKLILKENNTKDDKDWTFKCSSLMSNDDKNPMVFMAWEKISAAPIMVPIVYDTKNECMKSTKEFNTITLTTIKKERNANCKQLH